MCELTKKTCSKCGEDKSIDNFSKGRNACKQCQKEYHIKLKEEFENNPDKPKLCKTCNIEKTQGDFYVSCNECKQCRNDKEKIKNKELRIKRLNEIEIIPNGSKICKECGEDKPFSCYRKRNYGGYRNKCKDCEKIYMKNYNIKNNERLLEQKKLYRENNPNKRKEYYEEHREEEIQYNKEYREKNIDTVKEKCNIRHKERYLSDIIYRTKINIRNAIGRICYGGVKTGKSFELLGCDIDFFMKHIESQFTNEMTWENKGSCWHIDHIKPMASFKELSTCPIEQRLCSNWRNLQPLEAKENLLKGDKWDESLEENIIHEEYLTEALIGIDIDKLEVIIE